jgi:tRNA threonylcarbamoyladenosine biosynthesis protein TsaE
MSIKIESQNKTQTERIGKLLSQEMLLEAKTKSAKVLALTGELGSGKTTFLQGFAKGLGIKQRILSPTFVIQKAFKVDNKKFKTFYHIDCYRIQKQKEILDLGFKNIIGNPESIIAIEWADRIKKILPRNSVRINFKFIEKNKRDILIK